jgi:hypothetical protein
MATNEIQRRTRLAIDAIRQAFGADDDESGATLFVMHHLEELPASYWQQHLRTGTPEPAAVLELLELKSNWGDDDLENFDFSLPGDATNYVVSVHFDGDGNVDGISMES